MTRGGKTMFQILAWVIMIGIVFIIGIHYFPKEDPSLSFWASLYFTIRVFILEQDLAHFPTSAPLIFIYFFAPALAVSAVGTIVSYVYRFSPPFRVRWLKDHVIICGMGRIGQLLAEILKGKGVKVVGVDIGPPDDFEEWLTKNKVPIIFGDFHSRSNLEKAGAERARTIIFASGEDLINLEAVVAAYSWLRLEPGPPRILWAHIANEKLAGTARAAIQTRGALGISIFDTYHIAATKIVAKHFNKKIRENASEINILGFGKFGRDLMEVLIRDFRKDKRWTINVVDRRDVQKEVLALVRELDFKGHISVKQAAIQDLFLEDSEEKAFFLCTDDDIGNLAGALMLASKVNCTHIYVRMATWPMPAIADHLGEKGGLTFININNLIIQGIDDLPGIFHPAKSSDLNQIRIEAAGDFDKYRNVECNP